MLLEDNNFLALVKKAKQIAQVTKSAKLDTDHLRAAILLCFNADGVGSLLQGGCQDWKKIATAACERLGIDQSTHISEDDPPKFVLAEDLRIAIEATKDEGFSAFIVRLFEINNEEDDQPLGVTIGDRTYSMAELGGRATEEIDVKISSKVATNHDIFISFKSEDKTIAEKIYSGLNLKGVKCWISSRDIAPGADHKIEIPPAIKSSQVMLLVFSSNTLRSNQITKEIDLAEESGIRIIPIRVENVEPRGAYVYGLKGYQYLDIFDDLNERFNEHLSQIYNAVSRYLAEARDETNPELDQQTDSAEFIQDSDSSDNKQGVSHARFSNKNDKKTRALEICDNNSSLANGPLAKIIQKELGISYSNAYYYVSRVWKRPGKLEIDEETYDATDASIQLNKNSRDKSLEATSEKKSSIAHDSEGSKSSGFSLKRILLIIVPTLVLIASAFIYYIPANKLDVSEKSIKLLPEKTTKDSVTSESRLKDYHPPSNKLYGISNVRPIVVAILSASDGGSKNEELFEKAVKELSEIEKPAVGDIALARLENEIGIELFRKNKYSDAAFNFYKALKHNPKDSEVCTNLAAALLKLNEPDLALDWVVASLSINATRVVSWVNLAEAYAHKGKQDEAMAALRVAIKLSTNPEKLITSFEAAIDGEQISQDFKLVVRSILKEVKPAQ